MGALGLLIHTSGVPGHLKVHLGYLLTKEAIVPEPEVRI